MEELFTTKGKGEELKAIYQDNKFKVVFVYQDGSRYGDCLQAYLTLQSKVVKLKST